MEILLLIARLLLAGVFGVAGAAKAVDKAGSRRAMIGFGVPETLAGPLGRGLPYIEMLVAFALLPLAIAWWGAVAALALLGIFTIAITVKIARGESPDCHCFGQLHSEPVSWKTFARNLILAAVAGLVVVQGRGNPGLSAFSWLNDFRAADVANLILGVCAIGLLATTIIFMNRLLKEQAKLFGGIESLRAAIDGDIEAAPAIRKEAATPEEGLPIGAAAPKFALATNDGDAISLDDLLGQGKSVLLLFVSPNCWGCKLLLPAARVWQREYQNTITVALLSKGSSQELQTMVDKYEISNLLSNENSSVVDDYQAKWTPAAVLIRPDGKIASQIFYGDKAIRKWFRDFIASGQFQMGSANGSGANGHIQQLAERYSTWQIGERSPSFSRNDLSGNVVSVEDFYGSPTLLLFWHPLCEICKMMIPDLREWEENPPADAPKLVFISTGDLEEVIAVNGVFQAPTLLDPEFDIAPLFGTKFSPSAILLDEQGRIASGLAIGDQNVRALVGLPKSDPEAIAPYLPGWVHEFSQSK